MLDQKTWDAVGFWASVVMILCVVAGVLGLAWAAVDWVWGRDYRYAETALICVAVTYVLAWLLVAVAEKY